MQINDEFGLIPFSLAALLVTLSFLLHEHPPESKSLLDAENQLGWHSDGWLVML